MNDSIFFSYATVLKLSLRVLLVVRTCFTLTCALDICTVAISLLCHVYPPFVYVLADNDVVNFTISCYTINTHAQQVHRLLEEPINTRAKYFYESENGKALREELVKMVNNPEYNTKSMYSTQEKDGISFAEKHMRYMSQFPNLNCMQYISNLKLMTRIKK